MDDNQIEDVIAPPEEAQTPETPISSQPSGFGPSEMPPETPESPTNASAITPVESQNGAVNQPEVTATKPPNETSVSEPVQQIPNESIPQPVQETSVKIQSALSAPAPLTPPAPQPQSPAQQDQTGFIRALLAKAQTKIQSNKQKKLDKIIQYAQKKKTIANEDIQKLLHVSSATATRYLVKLVQQGHLSRVGNPRDAKYQFLH